MSLQKLLTDYPNYSARKVRRLARQLSLLEKVEKETVEPLLAKGIMSDLMDYNLQQAQLEEKFAEVGRESLPSDRTLVTPVAQARKAMDEMGRWMHVNTDADLKASELAELKQRCLGLITGSSFYTDRGVTREEQE